MDKQTLNPEVLSSLVKLIGVVVTWGTTIYFLWVKTPPPVISTEPFFDQVRRITMLVISVFLILSWGVLGNTANLKALLMIAVVLTASGITIFFVIVGLVERVRNLNGRHSAIPLLVGFFFYSTTISIGLTSAVEFLAVILLNPTNAAVGQSIVARSVYLAKATLIGSQNVQEDQLVPFRASSGQGNVGCGDSMTLTATYHLPPGASLQGMPMVSWENTSNLRSTTTGVGGTTSGGEVVGSGSAQGLPYEEFNVTPFGGKIRNCLGGGHGEIVLSGQYHSAVTHKEPKMVEVTSTVSAGQHDLVWVSLPSDKDWTLQRATIEFTSLTDASVPKATLNVTAEQPISVSADGKFRVELQMEQGRLGLSAAR